jgi:hypothetical protein
MSDQFDVFLSHHSGDGAWVLRLKAALESKGVRVWLDKDQIRPGDLFVGVLEQGIQSCSSVALVLSPGALSSRWVKDEYHLAKVVANTAGRELQLIPCLLQGSALPGFLSIHEWVDFRDPQNFDQSVNRLVWGITGSRTPSQSSTATPIPDVSPERMPEPDLKTNEEVYLTRLIAHESRTIRSFLYLRLAAPFMGFTVWLVASTAGALQGAVNLMVAVGVPAVTTLIGWAATSQKWTKCRAKVRKWGILKDGLELCRNKKHPSCDKVHEAFWEIVRQGTDLGES